MNSISPILRSNGSASTKEQIISALSNEFPLTAKQIFNFLSRDSGAVSYQAVHKALQEMEAGSIVAKGEKGYSLSMQWVDSMQQSLNGIKTKYSLSMGEFPKQSNMVFGSIAELDSFLIKLFLKLLHERADRPVLCLQWMHFWLPLFDKDDYLHSRELGKFCDAYCLSKGSTAIDNWCSKFWDKNKVYTKTGCNVASVSDLIVFEDIVIEVFYPPMLRKMVDEVYEAVSDVSELNVDDFFEKVFQKKVKIPVIINRNAQVASQIREQTLEYFK